MSDTFDDLLRLHVCPECGWERYLPLDQGVRVTAIYAGKRLVSCAHYITKVA